VSSNEAHQDLDANAAIYRFGTRYSLILIVPIVFVLYTNGGAFIGLWMGSEYGARSEPAMRILCIGYLFYMSQIVANSVLKGISRHKVLAYILIVEAAANLGISLALAPRYGLEGVALGTTLPLVVANLLVVPIYTCRMVGLRYLRYLRECYLVPAALALVLVLGYAWYPFRAESYVGLILFAAGVQAFFLIASFFLVVQRDHREKFLALLSRRPAA